jgi:TPR repeat protein
MPRITISYRREDSGVITGRIFDRLAAHFGREAVFRDIDDIPPGVDFRKHISGILDESDIVLAIVGPRWIGPRVGQSRLANAADPVRVEIETALLKDRPLIPVLVLRGTMPRVEQLPESLQDFAYRHAVSIDAGQDFDVHMARLIRAMDRSLEGIAGRAARGDVEGFAAAIDAAPSEPEAILDRAAPPEPEPRPPSSAEIEALREVNRALEQKLAALATEPEVARTPDDLAPSEVVDAAATPLTDAIAAVRARTLAPAQDPRSAQRLLRGAAFLVIGVLLGIAVTFGANQYLMRDQPILSNSGTPPLDAGALATARQAAEAKAKALQEELTAARLQADQDRKKQTDALAAAQEKTAAAQKQLNDQANGLRGAQTRADKAEKDLAAQKDVSANALAQSAPLNGQIKSLGDQLAAQKNANSEALARTDQLNAQIKALSDQLAAQKDTNRDALAQIDRLKGQIKDIPDQPAAAPAPTAATATAESEANWSVEEKREIQLILRTLGHLAGEADGNFGPGTRTAINQFQSFQGAPETGVLSEADRKTLLDMAQHLSHLLERPATSPEGVAAGEVKGAALRYARGLVHETGKGGRKDPAEAAYWYGLAAADGSATALTNLGTLVARGYDGANPDPAGAAILWWAAAARGEATAMFNLGALWERGIGVTADIGKARAWYERAAARNDTGARAALKRLGS